MYIIFNACRGTEVAGEGGTGELSLQKDRKVLNEILSFSQPQVRNSYKLVTALSLDVYTYMVTMRNEILKHDSENSIEMVFLK